MFDKQELAIIHKAISEMTIKGTDAPKIALLLQKVAEQHTSTTESKSTNTKRKA